MGYCGSPALKLKGNLMVKQKKLQEIGNVSKEIELLNVDRQRLNSSDKSPTKFTTHSSTPKTLINKFPIRRISNKNGPAQDLRKMVLKNSMKNCNPIIKSPSSKLLQRHTDNSFQEAFTNYVKTEKKKTHRDFSKETLNAKIIMEYNSILNSYPDEPMSEDCPQIARCFTLPTVSRKILDTPAQQVNTEAKAKRRCSFAVSYTHLTLPTICSV
eukprot:TRINITY_DN1182_c0_g4_i1.p1 TRINITY_DN1182_c0_g4~~TRINITY_DN1182_c0_g4_i1.p1  ORF type:complete len:213 (+),score=51.82 TRINITY_DN1182_c0_g4_i1:130-768(+)